MANQSSRWWAAVEGNSEKYLTRRMFTMIKDIYEPEMHELEDVIRRGANLKAKDAYGRTPLKLAKEMKRYNIVELIENWQKPGSKGRFVTATTLSW